MIICFAVAAFCLTACAARLASWQIVHGEEYRQIAERSTSTVEKTEAVRGQIFDSSGNVLVGNTTQYRVSLQKQYIDEAQLDKTILLITKILDECKDGTDVSFPIISRNNGYEFTSGSGKKEELQKFLSLENSSAADCVNALRERYDISKNYSGDELITLVSVHYSMEQTGFSVDTPFVLADDVSFEAVAKISEKTQGLSGVAVESYLVRQAKNPTLAPHIIGAVGAVTEEEYNKKIGEGKSYELDGSIGKFGIEAALEDYLKGEGGQRIVRRSLSGEKVEEVQTVNAKNGSSVYLTINSEIQQAAEKALSENVALANKQGAKDCNSGAAVMVSVKDFSVLAAASCPSYDLNKYSEYGDYYLSLAQSDSSPMYNRATVGSYACGSVFKPFVASVALEEGVIDSKTKINCTMDYDYYPTDIVKCMHRHGELDLNGAVAQSCNYFFAETGRRLGIQKLDEYAERFGLGTVTGIEIEESGGTLAGRDSTDWQEGNVVSASIGQSDNAFTPLQLAVSTATLANDGVRLKAHMIDRITDYSGKSTLFKTEPEKVCEVGISQKNLESVQNAMLSVTQSLSGTAYSYFGDYKVKVAAKTGTAENSGTDHTTFICYAPFDEPEVAVAVVIEHGASGKFSMLTAKAMLDSYFKAANEQAAQEK